MTDQYATQNGAARSSSRRLVLDFMRPNCLRSDRRTKTGAVCTLFGLASPMLVAPTVASAAPAGIGPFAAGERRRLPGWHDRRDRQEWEGTTVEANGEVNVYPPGANGDVAPQASFTKDMYGPFTVVFDPSGDLWADNVNTSTLVEITRAQLATPNPVPAVTISSASGLTTSTTWPLTLKATSGQPVTNPAGSTSTPRANWPARARRRPTPLFRPSRASPAVSALTPPATCGSRPKCPRPAPTAVWSSSPRPSWPWPARKPTVTISSTGGTSPVFTASGNLWMVTGGGPKDDCFGTPCTNELVEFTKAQLATSGSPTPAVTISSTKLGAAGSLWGPYGLAFTPSGDVWVSNYDKPTAVEFGRGQLATSGSPTPVRTIVGQRPG